MVSVLGDRRCVVELRISTAEAQCIQDKEDVIKAQQVSLKALSDNLEMSKACVQQANQELSCITAQLAAANAKYALFPSLINLAAAFLADGLLTDSWAQCVIPLHAGDHCCL